MINLPLVFSILSLFLIIISISMSTSLVFAILFKESTFFFFLKSIGVSVIVALLLRLLSYRKQKEKSNINLKDSFLIVGVGWVIVPFFSALPFYFSGYFGNIVNCYFEAVSGYTTTGASILENIEAIPKSLLYWRSMTHFLGGMGFVVLSVSLLQFFGIDGGLLFKQESPGPIQDRITAKIAENAQNLWIIYSLIGILEILFLKLSGLSLYDSIIHTFGTIATGGFSNYNSSVSGLNNPMAEYVIIVFMFLSGVNFALHFLSLKKKNILTYFKSEEFKWYLFIVLVSIGLTFGGIVKLYNYDFELTFRKAAFQVVSIITTTGFATENYLNWPIFTHVILIFLMFVGAMGGSTGGGIKVSRIIIAIKFILRDIRKIITPNKLVFSFFENRQLELNNILRTLSFIIVYLILIFISTLLLTIKGHDIITSFSAVLASISNIGPGLGKVGPIYNYNFFDDFSKLLLSFLMIIGRLEIFTILVLFIPPFWKKN